jgi:hypothetical protein
MSINNDLTEEEYRIKYLKYKEKYVALKNQSAGASASNCNSVWKDAGWSTAPCTLCQGSINVISKCCIGYRSAKKQLGKTSINFGKQMFKSGKSSGSRFDELCKCGHWASKHNPLATRTFAQFGFQREQGILNAKVDADGRTNGLPIEIFKDRMTDVGKQVITEFSNLYIPSLIAKSAAAVATQPQSLISNQPSYLEGEEVY